MKDQAEHELKKLFRTAYGRGLEGYEFDGPHYQEYEKEFLQLIAQAHKGYERRGCHCIGVKMGTYANQVVLAVPQAVTICANSLEREVKRIVSVDTCVAREVQELWRLGIATTGCCCGHGKTELAYIGVEEQYIPRMTELGYTVRANSNDPSRQDSFVPKSVAQLPPHNATQVTDTSVGKPAQSQEGK